MTRYQKLTPLAEHSRGGAYLGRQTTTLREVVIKELRNASLAQRDRFFSESRRWAQHECDWLVAVRDIEEDQNWVILDRMRASAADRLRAGPLPPPKVADILWDALEGLRYLHHRNQLHGNLKPTNLLVDEQGRWRLADGRSIPRQRPSELPRPGGTAKYVAPESIDPAFGPLGAGSDLYSLAMIALELLIGPALDGLIRGTEEGVDRQTAWIRWHTGGGDQALVVADLAPAAPAWLAELLDRLLVKQVIQRLQSADEALAAMTAAGYRRQGPGQPAIDRESAAGPAGREMASQRGPADMGGLRVLIASGPRMGELCAFPGPELVIGATPGCDLQFATEEYPGAAGRQLRIRCLAGSWTVTQSGVRGLILDGRPVHEATHPVPLGGLVRMSVDGPDFQLLAPQTSLDELAEAYGLAARRPKDVSPQAAAAGTSAAHTATLAPPEPPAERGAADRRPAAARVEAFAPAPPSPPGEPPRRWTDRLGRLGRGFVRRADTVSSSRRNWLVVAAAVVGIVVILALTPSCEDLPQATEPTAESPL